MGDEYQAFACRHRNTVFDDETGEHVCDVCGKVMEKSGNETLNGIGFPALLGSRILEGERDKLQVHTKLVNDYPNEVAWYNEIENLCDRANMPEFVLNSVFQSYLKNRQDMRKMHKKEAVAALIYAYGKERSAKTFQQICEETSADKSLARRYLFHLASSTDLKIPYRPPEEYVALFAAKMNAPKYVAERAVEIAQDYEHGSESPRTLAASSLYLAYRENGERRTQSEIGKYTGVAEYTIREAAARMKKALGGAYER